METVRFKRNWIWKVERFFFPHVPEAKDTCTLRWRLMKILFSLPITFMTWVYIRLLGSSDSDIEDKGKQATLLKIVTLFFMSLILYGMLNGEEPIEVSTMTEIYLWVGVYFFSTLLIGIPAVLIIFIVGGIGYLISEIPKPRIKTNRNIDRDKEPIFKTLYQSLKEKFCNRIEWIDHDKEK